MLYANPSSVSATGRLPSEGGVVVITAGRRGRDNSSCVVGVYFTMLLLDALESTNFFTI